jgi:RNA polymerase sigma-70 factor (ECF subfamily)
MNLATDGFRRARRRLLLAARLVPDPHPPSTLEGMAVAEALQGLPLAQCKAVVLHYLLDLPVDQVATNCLPLGRNADQEHGEPPDSAAPLAR